MTIIRKTATAIAFLGIVVACSGLGNEGVAQERGRRHHGPPPEAYTACEGKAAGDRAEFTSPRGDTVTGTCEANGDRLVLRPDNPPPGRQGRRTTDE